jgi:hypothetical protein
MPEILFIAFHLRRSVLSAFPVADLLLVRPEVLGFSIARCDAIYRSKPPSILA